MPFPYRIVVKWSEPDDAFVARVPALPACAAHGETEARAIEEVHAAAKGILAVMRDTGRAVPPPDGEEPSGKIHLRLPTSLHAHLAERAEHEGVSLNTMMVTLLAKAATAADRAVETLVRASAERPRQYVRIGKEVQLHVPTEVQRGRKAAAVGPETHRATVRPGRGATKSTAKGRRQERV